MTNAGSSLFKRKNLLVGIFGFFFMFVIAVILVIPFIYLAVTSLKDMAQYYSTDFVKVWFPRPLHWENYIEAFTQVDLLRYIFNSIALGGIQTILVVFSSATIAYGFARFKFPGRDILFLIVLGTMMLPAQVTNIPLFLFFRTIKWTNSFLPLIVPCMFGSAWHIFLIRQFMLSIPKEMEEAAMMDGCNSFKTFTKIILPQSMPALIVSGLFQFLYSWKDLLGPLIYLSDNKLYTLPVGLLYFESPTDVKYTVQLAAVVVALLPTVIFFIVGKRYFESGINIAELK
ncbi:MAG: carbohydrate ABC transporter permease [Spirochaetales bacterium]|nr:carbohydrate ABC transporter permease [Spirochaetales bacterium]